VIRVVSEAARRPRVGDDDPTVNNLYLGKRSVRLNLAEPRGLAIAKRLVAISDVVVENQRPGSVRRLGLGYETLREVRPDVIAISLSTTGHRGGTLEVGYAPNFVARSGVGAVSGYEGGPPAEYVNWPDFLSGHWLMFALFYALLHRARTGEGQYIDLSAVESLTTLIGDVLIEPAMTGRSPAARGNRDARMAPHGAYRCSDGAHVAIAVGSDAEWRALCAALGNPALADHARYATAAARKAREGDLDALVGAWAAQRTVDDALAALREHRVVATKVMSNKDLFQSPHLRAQGRWRQLRHATLGERTVMAPPWDFSETPARIESAAPLHGADEGYVYGELLGITETERERLEAEGVIR
jgi:benzylsuccinate CoA-transferase BbsF subunit